MTTVEELVSLLQTGTQSPEEKAEIGRQLAELGDPRPGVGVLENGLPDIDWVNIPAGDFIMGSSLGDLTANISEVPQSTVTLPTYYISRYPITFAQFGAFVDDGGYDNNAYWTKAGNAWCGNKPDESRFWKLVHKLPGLGSQPVSTAHKSRPECCWGDPMWHISNCPVVGITWYEATAFCAWLSQKVDFRVWLPSETEWEKAARGTDKRRFPWGNQFYPQYANCGQTMQVDRYNRDQEVVGMGRTTPVGIFPDGASPYGAMDMCGNVWEWCATIWRSDYSIPEDNTLEGLWERVLRGGSWNEREVRSRTTSRGGAAPDTAADTIGFRICAGR